MTQVEPQAAIAPAAKYFRAYGWHTYNWSTYYQPSENGLVFVAFSVATQADPTRLTVSYKINIVGSVTISWGTRPGGYSGRSLPQPAVANAAQTFQITGLDRKKTYYLNATANVAVPNVNGGQTTLGSFQAGEISVALP